MFLCLKARKLSIVNTAIFSSINMNLSNFDESIQRSWCCCLITWIHQVNQCQYRATRKKKSKNWKRCVPPSSKNIIITWIVSTSMINWKPPIKLIENQSVLFFNMDSDSVNARIIYKKKVNALIEWVYSILSSFLQNFW